MAMFGNRGVLGGAAGGAGGPATQLTETTGPTDLDVAGIADGEYLKRNGTDIDSGVPAGGAGTVKLDDHLACDDNTDLDASASEHGLLPKLSNVATEFLNGQGGYTVPTGAATKLDDHAACDDNTDLNVSTSAHGLAPKLSNTVTEFLNGQGGYTVPTGAATKLDDHAACDDNTDLDMTSSAHGLAPKGTGAATDYLDGTGAFSVPAAGAPAAHDLSGALHNSSTVTTFNAKLDDANIGWVVSNKTSDYSVSAISTGTCFTNAGASGTVIFTLPAASSGQEFMFIVDAAFILRITTNGGADNIRIGDTATAGAGSIESASVGDAIVIKCINADDWVAITHVGNWNLSPSVSAPSPYVVKTADYTVVVGDSGTCFANTGASGAVIFTLPGAAAGLEYTFFCHAAQTVTITCTTGDTIRVLGSTTSADGTAYTATSGTVIHIKGQNANGWFTMSQMGTWTLT